MSGIQLSRSESSSSVINGGLPGCYPIVVRSSLRARESTREDSSLLLDRKDSSGPLYCPGPLSFRQVFDRRLLPDTATAGDSVPGSTPLMRVDQGTQGGAGRRLPRLGTPTLGTPPRYTTPVQHHSSLPSPPRHHVQQQEQYTGQGRFFPRRRRSTLGRVGSSRGGEGVLWAGLSYPREEEESLLF